MYIQHDEDRLFDLRHPRRGRPFIGPGRCLSQALGKSCLPVLSLPGSLDVLAEGLELVEDLLTLAREGGEVLDAEPVELAPIARSCWRDVETADGTLVVDTDRVIRADAGRLRQLLENLMTNAVIHGGDDVTVTIGDVEDGFFVADDGIGIPAHVRARMFDQGYSTAQQGTGFGLNIVRSVAEGHGWNVSVTESEGGGARFEVTDTDPAGPNPP